MKRKKELIQSNGDLIFSEGRINIQKYDGCYSFQIGKEFTGDLAEAVSILMKLENVSEEIWNLEVGKLKLEEITPAKSLYWLSGGYEEWNNLEHYNTPWSECYLDFQEEFGLLLINIVKRSKKLSDIRDGFKKNLNLPTFYDYGISIGIIR